MIVSWYERENRKVFSRYLKTASDSADATWRGRSFQTVAPEAGNVRLPPIKSNYFIVRPKVDQRAGLLSLPHLGLFAIHTRYFLFKLIYIAPYGCNTRGAGQCV